MKVARNPCEYFADRLQRAMKGVGTDESDLTRVIVSRSEVSIVVTFLVFVPYPATSKLIICAPPPYLTTYPPVSSRDLLSEAVDCCIRFSGTPPPTHTHFFQHGGD